MNKQQYIQLNILFFAAAIFHYLFLKYEFSLGGSFVLCFLIFFSMPIVLVFKELGDILIKTCLVLCGLMILNFLAYWEPWHGINGISIGLLLICIFWIILLYLSVMEWLFIPQIQLDETGLKNLMSIRSTISMPLFFMWIVSFFGSLLTLGIYRDASDLYLGIPILRAYLVSATSLLLAFLISLVYLYKIDDLVIKGLLLERVLDFKKYELLTGKRVDSKAPDKKTIIKWYKIILVVIIVLGTGLELMRGMWLMWIETVLLLMLMSSILWRIYRVALK